MKNLLDEVVTVRTLLYIYIISCLFFGFMAVIKGDL